ncbi:MAG: hypothetical protein ACLPVY_13080 [Acidimicrobiia bacterium]
MERGNAGGSAALRDLALRDVEALIQVIAEARKDLRSYQSALNKTRRHLEAGGRASDTSALFDIATVRLTLSELLNRIERARSASRLSFWRLQVSEGKTIAEVARTWGFSRQLVSRALSRREVQLTRSRR